MPTILPPSTTGRCRTCLERMSRWAALSVCPRPMVVGAFVMYRQIGSFNMIRMACKGCALICHWPLLAVVPEGFAAMYDDDDDPRTSCRTEEGRRNLFGFFVVLSVKSLAQASQDPLSRN